MAHTKEKRLPPIHPGEVLQDLLNEAGLTPNAVALALRVPANPIRGILKASGITGDTALQLAGYFGTSAQMSGFGGLRARRRLGACPTCGLRFVAV